MGHDHLVVAVRRANTHDSFVDLAESAYERARAARGGVALLHQLWGSDIAWVDVRDSLLRCAHDGHVWVALEGEQVIAAALVRERCVQAIWVQASHRRQHVASSLLDAILADDESVIDAWALPGDRATKSLYESVGWKARLLTMRGE